MFDPTMEIMSRADLQALQLSRLQDLCRRVYANVPFYRSAFDERGITPDSIRTLDDLRRLPFTEKQNMRDNYPFGLFAVPQSEIVRLHCSSGTTGKATVVGYTCEDLVNWSGLMARCMAMAGANENDTLHNSYGYGLFTGGLGAHYGGERLGMTVVPMSGGSTRRQVQLMRDFGATVLSCTPSYALHLYEEGLACGIDMKALPLRIGIFGGEPWTQAMCRDIEDKMGIKAYNIYGLSEVMGPGVAMECQAKHGMHIHEDHFIAEIIDPVTLEPKPLGEEGELVLTTITKQGSPLIRYRTHDLTELIPEPCPCGRTHLRIGRLKGRSDDMLIIRGVNFFPSQVESLLLEVEGVSPHYQIILTRTGNLDEVEVCVEVSEGVFSDAVKDLQRLERQLQKGIKEYLGVTTRVRLVSPHSISRSEGKMQRVIDKR